MENWKNILPILLLACAVGICANLIFFTQNKKITGKRILKEIFGALWISLGAYFILKQYTRLLDEAIYFICSIVALANSQIINFLGKDLTEAIGKGIVTKIKIWSGQGTTEVSIKQKPASSNDEEGVNDI